MSEHSSSSAWRAQPLGRRGFLRVTAASAATVALVAATGCETSTPTPTVVDPYQLALPSGDPGLFYYGYLLSLAQSTLYEKVVSTPPSDFTAADRTLFLSLYEQEVIYRELFRYYIDPTLAAVLFPTDFAFKLTSFTLTTRAGVLAAAQQLEDLAAAAYPALLPLFTSASSYQRTTLLKVASAQARHSATVRDLLTPGSFANSDVVDAATGQLRQKTPAEVTTALAPYFAPYVISVANLTVPV